MQTDDFLDEFRRVFDSRVKYERFEDWLDAYERIHAQICLLCEGECDAH